MARIGRQIEVTKLVTSFIAAGQYKDPDRQTRFDDALQQFEVVSAQQNKDGDEWVARYIEAQNGSGTRFVGIATVLPPTVAEGGPVLVSILYPWERVWPMPRDSELSLTYVAEKFGKPGYSFGDTSERDLAGIAMLVSALLS